jgi:hypothetical protein
VVNEYREADPLVLLQSAMADSGNGKAAYFFGSLGFGGFVTESVGNIGIAFLTQLLSVQSGPNSTPIVHRER